MKWPYEENYEKWDGSSALCNEDAPSVGLLQSRKKCHSTFPLIQKLNKNMKWGGNICLGVMVTLEKFCWSSQSSPQSLSFAFLKRNPVANITFHFAPLSISIAINQPWPFGKKEKKDNGETWGQFKKLLLEFSKTIKLYIKYI